MATQANFQIQVRHPRYVSDTTMVAKLAAVDLATDLQFPGINQSIALMPPDATVVIGIGLLERTFSIIFTAEFLSQYTDDAAITSAMQGLFWDAVRTQMPAGDVAVLFTLV